MNDLRHYYLYAKGHYEKDLYVLNDLCKIHAVWCGIDPVHVDATLVAERLVKLAFSHMQKNDHSGYNSIWEFLCDLHPANRWKFGANELDFYWAAVIKKCLSIIRWVKVSDIPFDLGEPDPSLLPLAKKG